MGELSVSNNVRFKSKSLTDNVAAVTDTTVIASKPIEYNNMGPPALLVLWRRMVFQKWY